ncbi:MAG: NAD(+) diphosphatase [Rhodospirillaceae bacterium]
MKDINHYADAILDRVAHLRRDEAWLRSQFESEHTRIIPVWRSRNLIGNPAEPAGVMLRHLDVRQLTEIASVTVLLGVRGETAYFAVDVSTLEEHEAAALHAGGEFVDLRSVGAVMDRTEASMLAYAKGIMHWHARHGFCGVCGGPTEIREAGHLRKCLNESCGAVHFPRTDPAVIMLVERGDRVLLGRKAEWTEGMYSTLAGFVEPGESLEQAVAREVMEEAGVPVANVRYHSSQPWPFPASLMLGFYADALTDECACNDDELEDLRWFTRRELMDGGAGIARRPRSDSIARRLIDEWIRRG